MNVGIIRAISLVLSLLTYLYTAAYKTSSELGLFSLIMASSTIGSYYFSAGWQSLFFVKEGGNLDKSYVYLALVSPLILFVIAIMPIIYFQSLTDIPIVIISLVSMLYALLNIMKSILIHYKKENNAIFYSEGFPYLLILVLYFLFHFNMEYYFLVSFTFSIIMMALHLLGIKITNKHCFKLTSKDMKSMVKISFSNILQGLSNRIDIFIVTSILGLEIVGVYALAVKIASLSTFALSIENVKHATSIAKNISSNKISLIRKSRRDSAMIATKFLAVYFPIALFSAYAFGIYFDKEVYILAATNALLLIPAYLVNTLAGVCGQILLLSGNEKYHLYSVSLSLLFNITFGILLVLIFDSLGALFAHSLSLILMQLLQIYALKRKNIL